MRKHLIIRFRRRGGLHKPIFEIALMHNTSRNRGTCFFKLGYFVPSTVKRFFAINLMQVGHFLNSGVILHPTVKKYLFKLVRAYV